MAEDEYLINKHVSVSSHYTWSQTWISSFFTTGLCFKKSCL